MEERYSDQDGEASGLPPQDTAAEQLKPFIAWFQALAETGGTLATLVQLELRLAAGDAARLFALAIIAFPIVLLTWIGLSVLLAWMAYAWSGFPTAGFLCFLLLQLASLGGIYLLVRRYRRSLSLPRTRASLRAIMQGDDGTDTSSKGRGPGAVAGE